MMPALHDNQVFGSGALLADLSAASSFSSRALLPMRFRGIGEREPFIAGGEHCDFGVLSLTSMWSQGRYEARTPDPTPASEDLLVTLCLRGSCEIRSRRHVQARAGQLMVLPCSGKMMLAPDRELATLSLRMPSGGLMQAMDRRALDQLLCRTIDLGSGVAAVLSDTLLSFWQQRHSVGPWGARGMADIVVRLLRAAFEAEHQSLLALTLSRQGMIRLIGDDICAHLANPAQLGVTLAAKRIGRSARAVQAALREAGTTFGAMVMEARLTQAARMLESSQGRHRSISELALSLGFEDFSHFSKRFRGRFGQSPRQYRASVRIK